MHTTDMHVASDMPRSYLTEPVSIQSFLLISSCLRSHMYLHVLKKIELETVNQIDRKGTREMKRAKAQILTGCVCVYISVPAEPSSQGRDDKTVSIDSFSPSLSPLLVHSFLPLFLSTLSSPSLPLFLSTLSCLSQHTGAYLTKANTHNLLSVSCFLSSFFLQSFLTPSDIYPCRSQTQRHAGCRVHMRIIQSCKHSPCRSLFSSCLSSFCSYESLFHSLPSQPCSCYMVTWPLFYPLPTSSTSSSSSFSPSTAPLPLQPTFYSSLLSLFVSIFSPQTHPPPPHQPTRPSLLLRQRFLSFSFLSSFFSLPPFG